MHAPALRLQWSATRTYDRLVSNTQLVPLYLSTKPCFSTRYIQTLSDTLPPSKPLHKRGWRGRARPRSRERARQGAHQGERARGVLSHTGRSRPQDVLLSSCDLHFDDRSLLSSDIRILAPNTSPVLPVETSTLPAPLSTPSMRTSPAKHIQHATRTTSGDQNPPSKPMGLN